MPRLSGASWRYRNPRFRPRRADTFPETKAGGATGPGSPTSARRGSFVSAGSPNLNSNSLVMSASLAVALMAVQFAAIQMATDDAVLRVVLPLTIALAPLALWAHRRLIGVWVIFVGLAANLAVIVANGGLMPIQQSTVIEAVGIERAAEYEAGSWIPGSKDVLLAPGDGRLVALGDSIVIRAGGRGIAASPGDFVVWAGLLVLAGEASLAWQRRERPVRRPTDGREVTIPRAEGSATTAR